MGASEQRLLPTMLLHAISAMHGENGLRERFAMEITRFADADQRRLERALHLAARLHADDRRQREPYLNHLLRVATRIICYYHVDDTDVVCAAILHEAVEDHPDELAAGGGAHDALAVLAAEFGPRVAELVAAVTNPGYAPGRDEHDQYRQHVAESLDGCPWARVIKASDFTDNGVGLIHTSGPRLDRLARKYAALVPVLRQLIARPDTPLDEEAKARILGQLDQAELRFAAILLEQDSTIRSPKRPSSRLRAAAVTVSRPAPAGGRARGDVLGCVKTGIHMQIACPTGESPLMYMPAIIGELFLGDQR